MTLVVTSSELFALTTGSGRRRRRSRSCVNNTPVAVGSARSAGAGGFAAGAVVLGGGAGLELGGADLDGGAPFCGGLGLGAGAGFGAARVPASATSAP